MDIWSSEEYFRHYSKIYIKAKRLNDEYMRRELLSRRVNRMLKRITHYFYYLVTKTMNISGMLILESRRRAKNFTILDLGGGAGDNYYTLRKFLNYSNIVWQIVDSPALWNRFHNERILPIYGDHLEFKDNFEPADLLLIVGTLQYILDDIPSFLNNVLISSSPQAVIFSRSPMLDEANDQFVSQIVSLLDETDKESKWVIPIRVHSLQLLIAEMQKLDFELWRHSKKWPYKLANCNDLKDTFYIDLYFKRNIFRE